MVNYKIYSISDKVLKEGTFYSKNENEQRKFFESFIGEFNDSHYMVFFDGIECLGNHFCFL